MPNIYSLYSYLASLSHYPFKLQRAGKLKCPDYYVEIKTATVCQEAYDALKRIYQFAPKLNMTEGSWSDVPYGCSVQVSSDDLHFNTHYEETPSTQYRKICIKSYLSGITDY